MYVLAWEHSVVQITQTVIPGYPRLVLISLSSSIKISGKSVNGFMDYDRTYKQTFREVEIITIDKDRLRIGLHFSS